MCVCARVHTCERVCGLLWPELPDGFHLHFLNGEQLSCAFVMCKSLLKYLFISFAYFLVGFFVFSLLGFENSLCILK